MMKKKLAMLLPLLLITALMLAACGLFGGDKDDGKTDGGKPGQAVTYTVTFETNGGGGIDAQTVEKDGKVSKPADPAKDGYGFEGWYKDAALEAVWDFTSDTVTKNTTLYAAWEAATVGLEYTLIDDGTAYSVSKGTANTDGKVVIPSSYNGKPVTSLGYEAFRGCDGLTGITIPDSVTVIDFYAFYGCSGLTSITIPNGATAIGSTAFTYCRGLTSITIPASVTIIGIQTFFDCYGLTVIMQGTVPPTQNSSFGSGDSGVKAIIVPAASLAAYKSSWESYASKIYGTASIVDNDYLIEDNVLIGYIGTGGAATVPAGVTRIGNYAFYKYSDITSITIPDSVTSIGYRAFYNCSGLTGITIPDSVTSIGGEAFWDCSGLTSITLPDGMTSIVQYTFLGCSGLTSITIPDSVTSIGDAAFSGCSGLTGITIPDGVTYISYSAFSRCSGLTSITVASGNSVYKSEENCILTKDGGTLVLGCKTSVIPDGVTSIGTYAFSGCSGLTSITIPAGVRQVGSLAFTDCTGLTEINYNATVANDFKRSYAAFSNAGTDGTGITVNVGANVTKLPADMFCAEDSSNSPKITAVHFAAGSVLTSIGAYAFSGCSELTGITLPDSVTDIGGGAFYGCSGLTGITVSDTNANYKSIEGILFNKAGATLVAYPAGKAGTTYTIPDSVTEIEATAFSGCSGITGITIPAGVTRIGSQAFSDCTGLTEINYNATAVTDFTSGNVFYNAGTSGTGITVNVGANVTKLPAYMFYVSGSNSSYNIPKITSVNFAAGSALTSIGGYAFSGCSGITSITIPDSVTSIGSYAFGGTAWYDAQPDGVVYAGKVAYAYKGTMPANTSITLLAGTKGIADYAFNGCSGLTSITIPAGVTSIGNRAFYNCSGLTSITLPSSVTSIGGYAFTGCSGLTSITIPASVTSIGISAFASCTKLTVINYRGTEAEWNAITKGSSWNYNCPAVIVYDYAG